MRNTEFPPSVLAAVLSACANQSALLNSERIERRFGSYAIKVLASEAGLRRSSLLSYDGDMAVCRTYSVVQFAGDEDERYNDAHSRVLAGDSIGSTFKDDGWDIDKHTVYIGTIRLPDTDTEIRRLMRLSGARDLALHVYLLVLVRESVRLEYATIMEAHHPDYLTAEDLLEIFDYKAASAPAPSDLKLLSRLVFDPGNRT